MSDVNQAALPAASEETTVSNLVVFHKPYKFEGEVYNEIDLAGMEKLTAEDMIAADKYLTRSGSFAMMPEMTLEYSCFIASRATSKPIEFFTHLPPRDAVKIKNRVTAFFYGNE